MTFSDLQDLIRIRCGRRKVGDPTLNSQPGAHTGSTRKYIPGYSDANIIYLDTVSGNDSNDGSTELLAKATYSSAATAAGSTKKIRVINDGATLSTNITKPTEMKRGVSGTIATNIATAFNTWSSSTAAWASGHNILRSKWFAPLAKFFVVGGSASSKVGYSADGVTFTESTTGFGSSIVYDIEYSKDLNLLVAVGADGKIETSPDGITWTTRTSGVSALLTSIVYSYSLRLFIAAGNSNLILKSPDGITWTQAGDRNQDIINESGAHNILCLFADRTQIIAGTNLGSVYRSTDGNSWSKATITNSDSIIDISFGNGGYIAGLTSSVNNAFESADGITWEATGAAKSIGEQIIYAGDLGWFISANTPDGVFWSTDGAAWTNASPAPSVRHGIAYSPELGILIGTGAGTIRYCDLVNVTISADIAGFSVYAAAYSGTVTAYNCTLKAPSTTAALSLNSCLLTESGANISNNTQSHFGTLVKGDFNITGIPAAQNAIAVNCCTIAGLTSLFNGSSTTYEQFRDNIMDGGFSASYAAVIQSGNIRGTNTNGLLSKSVRFDDPGFVDTTDYKLKRKTQGDAIDSPLVAAASYYVNEQGEQRDIGAWSLDDSALPYDYSHTFFVRKPAGQGLKPKKVPMASADQGIDGVWDATNEPARASEYLTFQCTSVPIEDVQAQDFIESLTDLTCEVCLDPKNLSPTTDIVVNGNHSAGEPVLNIDASTTIKSGMVLPIGGKQYFILYTIGGTSVTKLVLHKPLASAVSDNTTITPNEPVGDGTYQFVPQQRETPRPHAQETDVALNLSWTFVRQYPQI